MKDIINDFSSMEDRRISTIKALIENDRNSGIILISNNENNLNIIEAISNLNERETFYYNKKTRNSFKCNLLYGEEEDVIDIFINIFNKNNNENEYLKNAEEQLLINSLKVLKRFKGNNATLLDLNTLITNPSGLGRLIINKFLKIPAKTEIEAKENLDCVTYFLESYYNEKSRAYSDCIFIRIYISKLISNEMKNDCSITLNFSQILNDKKIILVSSKDEILKEMFLIGLKKYYEQSNNILSNYLIVDDDDFTLYNLKKLTDEENLEILKEKINIKSKKNELNKKEKESFGESMKKCRILAGLSQAELGEKLNITASFIGDIERNEKSLSTSKLIEFCKLFNLSLDELFLN